MEANGKIVVTINGKEITLTPKEITFERVEKKVLEEKYVPSVIEPSYGIGRIIYCVFEHCFKMREKDAQRTYFDFPTAVAPVKCSILPLMAKEELN